MPSAVQSRTRPKPPTKPPTKSLNLNPAIRPFQPKAEPAPTQLRLLRQERPSQGLRIVNKLRQLSTPIAFVMVLGVLPIYGWSVLTQRSWGTGYQRLEELRRDENSMIEKTEIQKYDITEQAETNPKGLVPKSPSNTLLIPRSQPRPNVVQVPQRTPFNPDGNPPLAY